MIQNTKCECGHQNPVGTILCESCGKPLQDDSDAPLEMRYDGVLRRSQRQQRNLLDRAWSFFSSVKVAIYLIIITLCVSTIGTILPQANTFLNPALIGDYFQENYGTFGYLYHKLGFTRTYDSWWFRGLLIMIGTSLVVCSLDRVLPLYRALSKQSIRKHPDFILRQKARYAGELEISSEDGAAADWVKRFGPHLKKKGYKVHQDGPALLAEKNRFSRWGPYINHIGLIVFLLAVLMRSIPGWHMDQYMGFLEGDIQQIPGTHYYLKNEQFELELYSEEELPEAMRGQDRIIPKKFETRAVLYECVDSCGPGQSPELAEVHRHDIIVNKPLKYKELLAYQFDFDLTPRILAVTATLRDKETGQAFGDFRLEMTNPEPYYEVGPYRLTVRDVYPDVDIDDRGQLITRSRLPNAPAFIFLMTGPGLPPEGDVYIYFPRQIDKERFREQEINEANGAKLEIAVGSMSNVEIAVYTSYLNIRVDKAMPFIWTGALISMIGLVMGSYWQHRRIWLRIDGRRLSLGGHTSKNWFGMRAEVAQLLDKMNIRVEPKALDNGGNKQ